MEIEKAIEIIKVLIENFKLQREDKLSNLVFGKISRLIEALEVAIQALEKQVGKKPDANDCCPDCNTYLKDDNGIEGLYCPNCGRKIDWGDEK